jgi:hypothetical protein
VFEHLKAGSKLRSREGSDHRRKLAKLRPPNPVQLSPTRRRETQKRGTPMGRVWRMQKQTRFQELIDLALDGLPIDQQGAREERHRR